MESGVAIPHGVDRQLDRLPEAEQRGSPSALRGVFHVEPRRFRLYDGRRRTGAVRFKACSTWNPDASRRRFTRIGAHQSHPSSPRAPRVIA
jgi:hypothetical protein